MSAPSRRDQNDRRSRLTAEVLVTIRYGKPVVSSRAMASAAPGMSCPAETMTPSMSSRSARVPARAARIAGAEVGLEVLAVIARW